MDNSKMSNIPKTDSKPRLKFLLLYFKQVILIGSNASKAPFLNDSKYSPFEVVPSGKIITGGYSYPSSINYILCRISYRTWFLF